LLEAFLGLLLGPLHPLLFLVLYVQHILKPGRCFLGELVDDEGHNEAEDDEGHPEEAAQLFLEPLH
jgi:hypothetical protein